MPWFVWVGVGVFVVLLAPAGILAATAVFRLLRALGSLNREMQPRTLRLQGQSEELNRLSAHATYRTELAKARIAMLQASLERIDVLLWALEDVRAFQAAIRGLIPRK